MAKPDAPKDLTPEQLKQWNLGMQRLACLYLY